MLHDMQMLNHLLHSLDLFTLNVISISIFDINEFRACETLVVIHYDDVTYRWNSMPITKFQILSFPPVCVRWPVLFVTQCVVWMNI